MVSHALKSMESGQDLVLLPEDNLTCFSALGHFAGKDHSSQNMFSGLSAGR